ncbi:unnamed protein product [Caenorhabditis angaria]|uniref:SXP/RAL-2 family protein Ani s 5-like cation-binding domain-containing protein n=1 Tax=Caenorhabditis angaria TaxID=860376 RepID=A0A9P1N5E7_9PELO|nr:unnamed protein product [Caenorhabditis angaria]
MLKISGIFLLLIILDTYDCKTSTLSTVSTSTTEVPSSTADLSALIETPIFLQFATDSQRKEYIELESNPNLTLDMKQKAELNWAARCGEPVYSNFMAFVQQKKAQDDEENLRMDQIVSQLSPQAQEADKQVRAISSDMNQTKKEMDTNVQLQLSKLPKKVYYELTFATQ